MLKKNLILQIFELDRPLPKRRIRKVIGLMKDELGEQIMKEVFGLRAKAYSYLKDSKDEDTVGKGTKNCVIKRKLKVEQDCLFVLLLCIKLFRSSSN